MAIPRGSSSPSAVRPRGFDDDSAFARTIEKSKVKSIGEGEGEGWMHDARPRNRSNFLKMLYQRHAAKCRSVDLVGAAVSRGRQAGRQEGSHYVAHSFIDEEHRGSAKIETESRT